MKESEIFESVQKVLVVTAHPDDAEIYAGGTIIKLREMGKEVRSVVTTDGGKGIKQKEGIHEAQLGELRSQEQQSAGRIMGIAADQLFNVGLKDGEVEYTVENIGKIVAHIREFKPDLVITHNPQDVIIDFYGKAHWVNHRDHRHTALITMDAVYPYSRDINFFPDHAHKTHTVTKFMIFDSYNTSNVRVDISKQMSKKREAMRAHANALSDENVEDLLSENVYEDGMFEVFRYVEIY